MGQTESLDNGGKTISAIILAKNEEAMIANCIASLSFVDQIIVVDSHSTDNTREIAKREGAIVIETKEESFAGRRNEALPAATGDWLLYIDADERITPRLAQEISEVIQFTSNAAFSLKRNNIHFGKWMEHGGWEKDSIVRLFKHSQLQKWEGIVHEHAIVDGNVGELKEPLVHLTHRSLKDGLQKSIIWTDMEASLLYQANVPKVTVFTLVRKTMMEFLRRLIFKKGFKDGMEGWIESMQQAANRYFVYERLWEMQQKPSLDEKYERLEQEIMKLWKREK